MSETGDALRRGEAFGIPLRLYEPAEPLTAEEFEQTLETIFSYGRPKPKTLMLSKETHDLLLYLDASVKVYTLPAATRWRGPDGKEWLEPHWETADVKYGNGNKARRRLGIALDEWAPWERGGDPLL